MTGKLNNSVFGQPTHRIISVLLHDIKTEGLVPGEGKLGIKRKSRVWKRMGLLGARYLFFSPLFHFSVVLYVPVPQTAVSARPTGSKLQCQCRYREEMGLNSIEVVTRKNLQRGHPSGYLFCGSSVFSETLWQACSFVCRFCLGVFKLNPKQKGCALPSVCDRVFWVVLSLLALGF